jgi:hypothetical protein
MVLTVPVRTGDRRMGHSRRTVLGAALGSLAATVGVAGCDDTAPAAHKTPAADPLNPLYLATAALLARYEATITAVPALAPRLIPLRDDHRQHLRALAREIGPGLAAVPPTASAGPNVPADAGTALAALAAAEKDGTTAARAACLAAPTYRAALLGSIAAARASHTQALGAA